MDPRECQDSNCSCKCHNEDQSVRLRVRLLLDSAANSIEVFLNVKREWNISKIRQCLFEAYDHGETFVSNNNSKWEKAEENFNLIGIEKPEDLDLFINCRRTNDGDMIGRLVENLCKCKPPIECDKCWSKMLPEIPVICMKNEPCRCKQCDQKIHSIVRLNNKLLWKSIWTEDQSKSKSQALPEKNPSKENECKLCDEVEEDLQDLFSQLMNDAQDYVSKEKKSKKRKQKKKIKTEIQISAF